MLLLFELSKEHETLPKAEVLACLEVLSEKYEKKDFLDGLLIIEASITDDNLKILAKRLAMTHNIHHVIKGISNPEEKEILETVEKVAFDEIMEKNNTFAVRVKSSGEYFPSKNRLEREIGEIIRKKGYKVNLSKPDKTFFLFLKKKICLFCLLLYSMDRNKKEFEKRKPHLRPFFLPGVIIPKFARAFVNLSRINYNEILLDSFCGTGGILLEAGMVGVRIIGIDVQEKVVRGAKKNLLFYGFHGEFIVGDATRMALKDNSIDAIVTDAPYGRSSLVVSNAEKPSLALENLYKAILKEIHRVLKNKGKAVLISHFPLSFPSDGDAFAIIEQHEYRVHKSLNRYITVLEKKRK